MTVNVYSDSFEGRALDPGRWTQRQIKSSRLGFSKESSDGKQSVAITTRTGDCEAPCPACCPIQRAEIRQAGPLRPLATEAFWQSFSFRVADKIPHDGSNRTVIGQWKAPNDDSPFLAQRYDNGVFHVTIQDNCNRKTVATAKGDPDRLEVFQKLVSVLSKHIDTGDVPFEALGRTPVNYRDSLLMAAAEIGRGTNKSFEPLRENLQNAFNFPTTEIVDLFEEFDYIQDLHKYKHPANCKVDHPRHMLLPDPYNNWVRMMYRIKVGRMDNEHEPRGIGQIDIFADGELISRVRGNLGYHLDCSVEDLSVYLKLGMYRDKIDGDVTILFDDFRQSHRRKDVM